MVVFQPILYSTEKAGEIIAEIVVTSTPVENLTRVQMKRKILQGECGINKENR